MNVVFVVLHYITKKDTVECVDSILNNLKCINYKIVIVENGSPNNSYCALKKYYKKNSKVHIIVSKKNLGFAKGNNLGYNYAKTVLSADFIVLLNNDTIIKQANFVDVVIKKYIEKKFHVLGPDIVSLRDGGHQNPSKYYIPLTMKSVKKLIFKNRFFILLSYFKLDILLKKIFRKLTGSKVHLPNFNKEYLKEKENALLHGACFIFSPEYIKRFKGLYSKTFLYTEENILYYIAQREKLNLFYSPELQIYHKEDSSTIQQFGESAKKRRKGYLRSNASKKWLLKVIMDDEEYKKNIYASSISEYF